jgi:predicted AAA+ superfamily ATPase
MNTLRNKVHDFYPDGMTIEAGIGSILLKIFGKENIRYWRTTNKQEIDFLIIGKTIFGFEIKKQYSGDPSSFRYFRSKYPKSNLKVLSLQGRAAKKKRTFFYPWELYKENLPFDTPL